ncbi:MAG TPA: ABC transporter substrate-binding protein [Nocardioidaceae bacterium]|nr:ABC transporter substrate-binding protein [Nocardioidaceae bacterium]
MTRLQSAWRLAAAGAAATLILASCGSDDDDSGGDDTAGGGEESPSESGTGSTAQGDGTLVVGSLLPSTGDLAFLGPPEFAGVDLAIDDINQAGGVLGQQVTGVDADSGDGTPNIAPGSTDKLLDQGADVIVGAASSSVSLSVIDKITGAGVVHFSPANTSTEFDTYDDHDLYFRTAPSDVLQGAVMGNLVVDDGAQNIAIMARQDSYGEALAENVAKTIEEQGATVSTKTLYNADATQFTAEVNEVASSNPDAIVLIAFNETTKIVPRLIASGVGPQDIPVYLVDGNCADYSADFDPGTLAGSKCTYPGAELTNDFKQRLLDTDPKLKDFTYGPESYDATIMSALAATAAGSDAGEAIGSELINISRDGTVCTEYSECVGLLEDGQDIDYDGVSGPCDLNDTGSPSKATIGIFQYENNNTYKNIEYVTGVI